MQQKAYSQKFLRQRKFLMVLPLLGLPFLVVIFIALGGGKQESPQAGTGDVHGLNLKLPDAHFKKGKEKDKLALYEQAGRDSLKIRDAIKNDPYYKRDSEVNHHDLETIFESSASPYNQKFLSRLRTSPDTNNATDPNEKRVMEKLAQLKTVLKNKQAADQSFYPGFSSQSGNSDIEKLQRLMNAMKERGGVNESDPELKQINGMLDKIMNIQHPEKMQDSMKMLALKNKPQTFTVHLTNEKKDISNQNDFFELKEEANNDAEHSNAIEAIVEESQTLVSGAVVKLRLLQDVYVNGSRIAKDQWVYGTASLSNERLKISITTLRSNDNILPVSLDVYDMDGLQGIYIPGSINRDVSKQSADDAISTIGLASFDPSLGAQAASAGIQAAKTLMSKKIKLVRVTVKAGYRVLLKDNSQETSS